MVKLESDKKGVELLSEIEADNEQPEVGLSEEKKWEWNSGGNVDNGDV